MPILTFRRKPKPDPEPTLQDEQSRAIDLLARFQGELIELSMPRQEWVIRNAAELWSDRNSAQAKTVNQDPAQTQPVTQYQFRE